MLEEVWKESMLFMRGKPELLKWRLLEMHVLEKISLLGWLVWEVLQLIVWVVLDRPDLGLLELLVLGVLLEMLVWRGLKMFPWELQGTPLWLVLDMLSKGVLRSETLV